MSRAAGRLGRAEAESLLEGLVSIPSRSRMEAEASRWLVERMAALGFERARVDVAGNAVGEMGSAEAERVLVLLGHIDTVAGHLEVRREASPDGGEVLHGRGTVDAKGPLAAFVAGAARVGPGEVRKAGIRLIVAGAVEEESATSKGARHLARTLDPPFACVIGEPSRWDRLTLGYKGRFLLDLSAERDMAHTAGPDPGVTAVAVELWNALQAYARLYNEGRESPFDQLLPSLRAIRTRGDGLREGVEAKLAARLPPEFPTEACLAELAEAVGRRVEGLEERSGSLLEESGLELSGTQTSLRVRLRAHGIELAHRAPRTGKLPASFLAAIREVAGRSGAPARPGFVVKTGTSDMNVVAPVWKCPILAYGPGDSALDHTPHESLDLEEYWRSVLVVEDALRRLLGSGPRS